MITLVVGTLTIIGTTVAGARWFDGYYAHSEALAQVAKVAEQQVAHLAQVSDRKSLENQLAIYRLQLSALRSKSHPTEDDLDAIAYLVKVIALVQQQLDGIVGGA